MPFKDEAAGKAYKKLYYQLNKDSKKEYMSQYRLNNKSTAEENRANYFWHKYGITLDDYDEMLAEQNFRCGICGRHISELSQPLHVDHDHTTGIVRGLLCMKCNTALGTLGDSVVGVERALDYLKGKLYAHKI